MNTTTRRTSTREILLRFSLAVFSLVMVFIVGEIASRLFFPDIELRYVNDPEALYHFEPNQIGAIRMGNGTLSPSIRINRLGLRGNDVTDSGSPKILVLGDSFTFGSGVADEETFAARLEQALGGKAAVVNGGQPGYGVFQMAATLRRLGDHMRPELVILVLWQGDLTRQPPDPEAYEKFSRSGRIRQLLKSSVLLTQAARGFERLSLSYGLKGLVFHAGDSNPPEEAKETSLKGVIDAYLRGFRANAPRFLEMHKEALKYGQGLFIVLWPKEDFAHVAEEGLAAQLTSAFGAFSRSTGIPFMSLQPAMRDKPKDILLIPNDWHPTPLAHCIVAQSIAAELSRLKLETFQSRPCSAKAK